MGVTPQRPLEIKMELLEDRNINNGLREVQSLVVVSAT